MDTLVDAILTVGTDLDLEHVLERVLQSACRLVDARYGILMLAAPDRQVTDFISYGLTEEERRRMSTRPDFDGILDMLFQSQLPRRFANVADAPGGFPDHPVITSLLAVPIAMRDETYGHIYLGNKQHAKEFTQEDEDAILALVTAAGIAIENARLYERERRRQQWLEAASEITRHLLGEVDPDQALRMLTRRLREVSGACYGALILLDPALPGTLRLEAVDGLGLEYTSGTRTDLRGLPELVIESGRALITEDLPNEKAHNPPPEWREAYSVIGLGMVLPLEAPGEILGVLYVGWRRGSPHERLAAQEVPLVEMFASQAALALQQVQAQQNQSRLLVLEDRDRIASDLHDAVIQRLFAIGTRLHSAVGLSTRPEVQRRIAAAIDDLDVTTREVRSAIFQLHDHDADGVPSMRDRLLSEVDAAREMFGFTPRLVLHGAADSIPRHLQSGLVAAIRVALALAANHTAPSQVEVVIDVDDDVLVLTVSDDGAADDERQKEVRKSAFTELAAAAERLDGTCTERSTGMRETTIEWRVPLREIPAR